MQSGYSLLKCPPGEDTDIKKKSCEVIDFGSVQERGPIESFEESKNSLYIAFWGSSFLCRTTLGYFELLALLVIVKLNLLVPISPSTSEVCFDWQACDFLQNGDHSLARNAGF